MQLFFLTFSHTSSRWESLIYCFPRSTLLMIAFLCSCSCLRGFVLRNAFLISSSLRNLLRQAMRGTQDGESESERGTPLRERSPYFFLIVISSSSFALQMQLTGPSCVPPEKPFCPICQPQKSGWVTWSIKSRRFKAANYQLTHPNNAVLAADPQGNMELGG